MLGLRMEHLAVTTSRAEVEHVNGWGEPSYGRSSDVSWCGKVVPVPNMLINIMDPLSGRDGFMRVVDHSCSLIHRSNLPSGFNPRCFIHC